MFLASEAGFCSFKWVSRRGLEYARLLGEPRFGMLVRVKSSGVCCVADAGDLSAMRAPESLGGTPSLGARIKHGVSPSPKHGNVPRVARNQHRVAQIVSLVQKFVTRWYVVRHTTRPAKRHSGCSCNFSVERSNDNGNYNQGAS